MLKMGAKGNVSSLSGCSCNFSVNLKLSQNKVFRFLLCFKYGLSLTAMINQEKNKWGKHVKLRNLKSCYHNWQLIIMHNYVYPKLTKQSKSHKGYYCENMESCNKDLI